MLERGEIACDKRNPVEGVQLVRVQGVPPVRVPICNGHDSVSEAYDGDDDGDGGVAVLSDGGVTVPGVRGVLLKSHGVTVPDANGHGDPVSIHRGGGVAVPGVGGVLMRLRNNCSCM